MKDLELVLEIAQKANDCVLLKSYHGVGKSDRLKDFGKLQNAEVVTLHLATQEVADLIGIPETVITEDGERITIWTKPSWLYRLEKACKEDREAILLLDELNRAPKDVLAACLSLVLDKRIHEHDLPRNKYDTFVVAAINPSDDGEYHTNELDPALLDRFIGPITLKADAQEWCAWARENKVEPVVIKFIASNPKYIHTGETSPRAWTRLSRLLKFLSKDSPVLFTVIKGCVGSSVGAEFRNFYINHEDMVSVKDIADIVKTAYDKNLSPEENLDITSPLINDLLMNQPPPVIHNLIEEVYTISKNKGNYLLINHLCYGIDLEFSTTFIKNLKTTKHAEFNLWADDPISVPVFARIVQKQKII